MYVFFWGSRIPEVSGCTRSSLREHRVCLGSSHPSGISLTRDTRGAHLIVSSLSPVRVFRQSLRQQTSYQPNRPNTYSAFAQVVAIFLVVELAGFLLEHAFDSLRDFHCCQYWHTPPFKSISNTFMASPVRLQWTASVCIVCALFVLCNRPSSSR